MKHVIYLFLCSRNKIHSFYLMRYDMRVCSQIVVVNQAHYSAIDMFSYRGSSKLISEYSTILWSLH